MKHGLHGAQIDLHWFWQAERQCKRHYTSSFGSVLHCSGERDSFEYCALSIRDVPVLVQQRDTYAGRGVPHSIEDGLFNETEAVDCLCLIRRVPKPCKCSKIPQGVGISPQRLRPFRRRGVMR
jgi:hypothetical protein